MIVNARREWLPCLTQMWKEAFQDEEEEIRLFHQYLFREELSWCYLADQSPAAVIYGIPATVWTGQNGAKLPVLYLYGGATRQELRGKGYYGALIREVARRGEGRRIPVLVPVKGMVPYYEGLGFHVVQKEKTEILHVPGGGEKTETFLSPVLPGRYKQIRDRLLGKPGYVEWGVDYLSYVLRSAARNGNLAVQLQTDREDHVVLARNAQAGLTVIDTTLRQEQLLRLSPYLRNDTDLPGTICIKGSVWMSTRTEWPCSPCFKISWE
jgi:GNAT superfamily N-acetyltransferase